MSKINASEELKELKIQTEIGDSQFGLGNLCVAWHELGAGV